MEKLDERGTAALEFCLIAVAFFTLIFLVFDLARYAITEQSLRMLANAGARKAMIDSCYVDPVRHKNTPTCSGDPIPSDAGKQAVAPFLYAGGLTPTLAVTIPAGATSLTVTASEPGFTMILPLWSPALNSPSVSTSIPF
jgi:hypothetical protein